MEPHLKLKRGKESIYHEAGRVLEGLADKKGSLKSLVFGLSCSLSTKKAVYALTSKSLEYTDVIQEVIDSYDLLKKEQKLTSHVAFVIVHDLVFNKNFKARGPLTRIVMQHKNGLMEKYKDVTKQSTLAKESTSIQSNLPRYVRVNTLKGNTKQVVEELKTLGFTRCTNITKVLGDEMLFCCDSLIPDLLVFNSSSTVTRVLISSSLYQLSKIVFQDKSSCLPGYILAPPPGSCIIDCCAAPGNKTSHLAALMNNNGTIYSYDKDKARHGAMAGLLANAGVTCVRTFNADFLKVSPGKYPDVKYIVVDPSCSGSGMCRRAELRNHKVPDKKRLKSLARFQSKILCHALSFPNVRKVIYSTCSIHQEENESVVLEALTQYHSTYELIDPLPDWKSRGLPTSSIGSLCIRVSPSADKAQGFFLALFQRKQ